MGQRMTHDFQTSLARSHAAEERPYWEECYRKAFAPRFQAMHSHRQDGDHQRLGIDRSVILTNGKQYFVDEKVRYEDYGDVFLEFWSDKEKKTKGWVCKDLLCDFIAYAIEPRGLCLLLPVVQLRQVWATQGPKWVNKYPIREVPNNGWTTVGCCVPFDPLLSAIRDAMCVKFSIPSYEDQCA